MTTSKLKPKKSTETNRREKVRDWLIIGWILSQVVGAYLYARRERRRQKALAEAWESMGL